MEKINKSQLGDRIRELRTAAGHTQDDLAALLDKQRQVVSYYENGTRTPNLSELMTIAKEYNTTTDYLLGLTETPTALNTDDDKALRICCDYAKINAYNITQLHRLENVHSYHKLTLDFINKVITFLLAHSLEIQCYCGSLSEFEMLFHLVCVDEDVTLEEFDDAFDHIRDVYNDLMVTEYKFSKAFERIFDNDNVEYYEGLGSDFYESKRLQIKNNSNLR